MNRKLSAEEQMYKSKKVLIAYNRNRSCVVCKEKIGKRPYVEPYMKIQHETCWNNTFERNLI
jgi:hypothetical protein